MKVDLRMKISSIKEQFKKEYPGLEIEVYKGLGSKQPAEDQALHKIAKESTGGDIEFGDKTHIWSVEKQFADQYGIQIQIKKGGALADNKSTLGQLKN